MKYLVMECHIGYAVVLDEEGRFIKAANMNYQVGQTVENIIMQKEEPEKQERASRVGKWAKPLISLAACLCIFFIGAWQYMVAPYGYVRLQINPDVNLVVNRSDRVVDIEPMNEDGITLTDGYDHRWKDVKQASDELAQRAIDMGFLSDGGKITLTVTSDKEEWRIATEEKLRVELEIYVGKTIQVVTTDPNSKVEIIVDNPTENTTAPTTSDPTTSAPTTAAPNDSGYNDTDYGNDSDGVTDYTPQGTKAVPSDSGYADTRNEETTAAQTDSGYSDSGYEEPTYNDSNYSDTPDDSGYDADDSNYDD